MVKPENLDIWGAHLRVPAPRPHGSPRQVQRAAEVLGMGALRIRALGPLELNVDGTRVVLGASQQRRVLAFLALRANSLVTTDSLVEALWPGGPPRKPVPQLQVYVANLRRVLDPDRPKGEPSHRLASRSAGYVLSVDEEELDLLTFQQQVTAGEQAVE